MNATWQQMSRAGLVLGAFAAVAAGVLAGTHALTRERIREAQQQRLLDQLEAVLPADRYDNALADDVIRIEAPALSPDGPVTVWRARLDGQPSAAILQVMTPKGYSGDIVLLVGVGIDGRLSGVRVIAHRETPGLGDRIDADRSDWILGFSGKSLASPPENAWAVRKDGGAFDQFAGATITPRAVVALVRDTLQYFDRHRDTLFAGQASPDETE